MVVPYCQLILFPRSNVTWSQKPAVPELQKTPSLHSKLLKGRFPDQVLYNGDKAYTERQAEYWTVQQAQISPSCRFLPHDALDIQSAMQLLTVRNSTFAIVSGEHSSVTGASNIQHGVTIDLSRLSEVTLVENDTAVFLGPGARWRDVYSRLEPHGLTVSGGRVAHVGVGGYVLGGGFSWFANQYGWTCDTVIGFEVVTPNAKSLSASKHENTELFWALKGSLGALGIVTRMKLPTIRNRQVYGGGLTYNQAAAPALFAALEKLNNEADADLKTQGYISFAWLEASKDYTYSAYLLNTDGVYTGVAFQDFGMVPHIHSGLRNTTISQNAEEINDSNPLGFRRCKFTVTVKSSAEIMQGLHNMFISTVGDLRSGYGFDPTGMLAITYQPITVPHLRAQDNIFHLTPEDGPLLLISAELWWTDAEKDAYFEQQLYCLWDAYVYSMAWVEALHPFVYPNYAAKWQKPFEWLEDQTKERLGAVKAKNDPEDVWRRLVPGLFRL